MEKEKPGLSDEDVCPCATNSHKSTVNFALCTNIPHSPGSGIGDPTGNNGSFFLILFSSFPLLFQPEVRRGRCRIFYLLQGGKTSPVVRDGGDKGSHGHCWGRGGYVTPGESVSTQVHAQGDGFLRMGENTRSSSSVRATSSAALCPGICPGLGERLPCSCGWHQRGRPGAPLIFPFSDKKQESSS